jgi:hypothetical protein
LFRARQQVAANPLDAVRRDQIDRFQHRRSIEFNALQSTPALIIARRRRVIF